MTIKNALNDQTVADEQIVFVIGDVRNPGSTLGVDSIKIET